MKRLIFLVIIAAIAWYGWKHYDELRGHGTHEAVLVSHSGRAINRIRLTVGGETLVCEALADNATAMLSFKGAQDSGFELAFQPERANAEPHWSGGAFTHGPVLTRHTFEFVDGDGVIWTSELKGP